MATTKDDTIDPVAYRPLLHTIAKGESKGNYNAFFGDPANTRVRFTDMTIDEVLAWQKEYVAIGAISNAVGKYQIISPTLEGLVRQLSLDRSTLFNEATQDKLAIALIERRGAKDFAKNKLSAEQFAANLAQEWAALPRITGQNASSSYYASDGVNKAHISPKEILGAITAFESQL